MIDNIEHILSYKTQAFSKKTALEWFEFIPFENAKKIAIKTYTYQGMSPREVINTPMGHQNIPVKIVHQTLSDALFYSFLYSPNMHNTTTGRTEFFEKLYLSICRIEKSIKLKG